MAFRIDVTLMTGRYDAGDGQDPRRVEWPPHPARVFSALRSVAVDDDDVRALRALEQLPAPTVYAAQETLDSGRAGYVVTNKVTKGGGNLTHLGRSSGLRERRSTSPRSPHVRLEWPVSLGSDDVDRLDAMAARVPYLGRSTSVALLRAHDGGPSGAASDGLTAYAPCASEEADTWLRTPFPGYVDELEQLFAAGLPAWQASDNGRAAQAYRSETGDATDTAGGTGEPIVSAYRDLVVLRFVGIRPAGRPVSLFTAALRSHVMRNTVDPLPPALSGHDADGQPHVAYLGLPFTGHRHADGHLVALAVAIPGLDTASRRSIMRGVVGDGVGSVRLDVRGIGSVDLVHEPQAERPRTALPETWTRGSRRWVSVTPVVLDRFPKPDQVEDEVRRSCVLAGLPAPVRVTTSPQPVTPGGIRLQPHELPRRARGRIYCHVRMEFDQLMAGPVIVGAGRYFGVGLFAPERTPAGSGDVEVQEVTDVAGS